MRDVWAEVCVGVVTGRFGWAEVLPVRLNIWGWHTMAAARVERELGFRSSWLDGLAV